MSAILRINGEKFKLTPFSKMRVGEYLALQADGEVSALAWVAKQTGVSIEVLMEHVGGDKALRAVGDSTFYAETRDFMRWRGGVVRFGGIPVGVSYMLDFYAGVCSTRPELKGHEPLFALAALLNHASGGGFEAPAIEAAHAELTAMRACDVVPAVSGFWLALLKKKLGRRKRSALYTRAFLRTAWAWIRLSSSGSGRRAISARRARF